MNELIKATTFQEDIATIKDVTTKVFLVAGKILQGIQDNKKYKEVGYKTFTEAVQAELGLNKSRAYQLIDAAIAYENVHNCGQNIPLNEAQLRPIVKLLPEQQVEIWQEVAKDRVPTAKEVQEAVNRRLGKSVSVKKTKVPMATVVDTTKYITIEEHEAILMKVISDFEEVIRVLTEEKEPLKPEEKSTLIKRQTAYNFVKERGNEFQTRALLNDNLVNADLYRIFSKVRETYKLSTPPPAWDTDIINATGIAD